MDRVERPTLEPQRIVVRRDIQRRVGDWRPTVYARGHQPAIPEGASMMGLRAAQLPTSVLIVGATNVHLTDGYAKYRLTCAFAQPRVSLHRQRPPFLPKSLVQRPL